MARTALDRAEGLFASGRYVELVSLLEPQVPVYRESQRFYYLLGSSCLRAGDPGGALAYLKRAEQLAPYNADTMLALAALAVRKGESEKAIEYYLRILEDRPGDRRARAGLATLRREGGPEGLARLVETGRIERLYPGGRGLPRFVLPAAIALAACSILYLAWPLGASLLESATRPRAARPEVSAVSLSRAERDSPVATGGSFRYALTEKQALGSFEKAKDYFQAYRDNAAIVEINRLLGSNASAGIKEKAKSLRAFVGKPDFRTVKDAPSYAEARRDPALYDGCSVVWKGMAANVRPDASVRTDASAKPEAGAKEGGIAFDFLVGYQDKKKLEGLVPARIAGAEVPMDRPLEILAVLRGVGDSLSMDCAAIHELVIVP
jgi:tetratricopeptide (TPR) repeat protein